PDLWGHHGMAREVAAITGNQLVDPVNLMLLPQGEADFEIEITDDSLCPRYSALVFENVKVEGSPLWMQARLGSIGLNGINSIVDVTNYVLAELPQPMHAFDANKLAGNIIFVRRARTGERLGALNGEAYELADADLVIADAAGPIALAGVIGGADTAISENTTRIVFESANFQAASVRLTSARHRVRTDASMRFEKAIDPENTVRGLARAIDLLREVSPNARPAGGVIDRRVATRIREPILLPLSFVVRKLGKELAEEEVSRILRSLGFGVSASTPELLSVTVPSWRATKDISLKDDLVEEVGRMVGYNEIAPVAPLVASVVPPSNPMRAYLRKLRRIIADQGFSEVYNYSFTAARDAERFQRDLNEHLVVRNPIAAEMTHMRPSLLPGLFNNVVSNVRHYSEVRLFEIGNEIHPTSGAPLPDEVTHLAAVLYAAHANEQNFFETKRVAECLFRGIELAAARETRPYEHPARSAVLIWQKTQVGRLFELHPSLLAEEGIEGRAVFFDVDLRLCMEISSQQQVSYTPLRKYPSSGFDLSVVADAKTPVGKLQQRLAELAGEHLISIEFIRQYQGAPLSENQKSVSYHLETGALDHTLLSEEAARIRQRIVQGMLTAGYEIRGID
ncbi:MAG: phenylalanine--tRNA ligase subunit beta, partial [Acidobacteriaceae bacterium]|nr:phenylalanine--tRNA ligase subunit beta [Acidobacteriaceae bacterium]